MVKQRRFTAVVAAIMLVLTMGSLSACGGGSGDSIVGFWKLISISGEDGVDQATLEGLEEDGLMVTFEATEDGAVTMDFMGDQQTGTWTGDKGTFKVVFSDGEVDAKVEGDSLTLADPDGELIFKRTEKVEPDAQSAEAGADIVGVWKLVEVVGDDEFDAETIALLEEMDMAIIFVATEEGTAKLDFMGEVLSGTWSETNGDLTITMDGETVDVTLNGDTLEFESDGTSLVFTRTDEEPSSEPADVRGEEKPAASAGDYPSFGETVTLPSGVELTVSGPMPYELSDDWLEESYPPEKGPLVAFDVVVVNGTAEEIDAWHMISRVVSDGQQADEVWDSSGGLTVPNTSILPGKSLKYKVAFQVVDPEDIQFSWEMSMSEDGKVHYLTD